MLLLQIFIKIYKEWRIYRKLMNSENFKIKMKSKFKEI